MNSLVRMACVAGLFAFCTSSQGAITYIDAVPDFGLGAGNTTLDGVIFDGTNLVSGTGASNGTIQGDDKWYYRTPTTTTNAGFPPNNGTFFETDGTSTEENAAPLITTITVPAPGTYNLHAMFIANTSSNVYGDIEVEVNNSGTTKFFYHNSATIPTQTPYDQPGTWVDTSTSGTVFAADSAPFPVATQWTAAVYHMYLGSLGQFDLTDTTVTFKVWGPNAKKQSDGLATFTRTLYEGVGYELIPPPPHPGDFDTDGDVDGTDFTKWQMNFPKTSGAVWSEGDADGDSDVDGADFVIWQTNFPYTPGSAVAPVPEPAALLIGLIGLAGMRISLRARSHCKNKTRNLVG
jgi:hypothetical protein